MGSYQSEACGILLTPFEAQRHIIKEHPVRNATLEGLSIRYSIDPEEFVYVDQWAEHRKLEICEFYHSHPDRPPNSSENDRWMARVQDPFNIRLFSLEKL